MHCTTAKQSATRQWGVVVAVMLTMAVSLPTVTQAYEVWVTDQSDTGKKSGGYLYIFDGAQLGANPSSTKPMVTIDLAGDIGKFCEEATKKAVRRPHMVFFTKDHSHAILSFLSGQVLFMDAATRKPEACISMGKNVHAAWPTPTQKMAIAANIAEKKLIRIWTDYESHTFNFDPAKDELNLAALESPDRPDTAPICPVTDDSGKYAFVTLRGGGLLVVDVTTTPMAVTTTLTNAAIHPAGCGGIQVDRKMYINSGGGWPVAPLSYDVYSLELSGLPTSLSTRLVSTRDTKFADSHGMALVGRYLWSTDRAGNNIEIIDTGTDFSVNTINLAGPINNDPAPDLIDVSPDGATVFVALRGPAPLTGNDKNVNNAKGAIPGVGVISVTEGGRSGQPIGMARVTNVRDDKETTDVHGIAVRR